MSLLLAFYTWSLFIPVWSGACPYATPLLAQLRKVGYTALIGVFMLRNWALTWGRGTMVRRLIHGVFNRRLAVSLPASSHNTAVALSESVAPPPNPQIKQLLERRSRRPFERVLAKALQAERVTRERGEFAARLDCSSLQWIMHNVSDSDAVAVAWQSLGALLEEQGSIRYNRIVAVLPGLVEYAGGDVALWRTLRLDGILDDLQLGRIARSALFATSFVCSHLRTILTRGVPISDLDYLVNTLSPDAALVYAHALPAKGKHIARVVRRLYKQGAHRPLSSTATFFVRQLQSESLDWVPEAVIGLLYYCDVRALPATAWSHITRVLGHSCISRVADPSHQCRRYCAVNAICARTLQLTPDKNQNSSAPFDAYSHIQLVLRITRAVERGNVDLSQDVWTVLTDTRHFSRRIRQEDRILAFNWASALYDLARRSNWFYASFATQYNSIWSRLLRGFVRSHPAVVLDEGVDFERDACDALLLLHFTLAHITPWQIEITDPALRAARLRSALALAESGGIAFCSLNLDPRREEIARFVRGMDLLAFFPTDLALGEEEHKEWVDLFVSAVQHLMVLDPLLWKNLRDAVTASTGDDVKTFFNEVHAQLTTAGPCKNGDCAGKAPTHADWLLKLGTAL
ncbi:hypothetical protein EXIGLDRAFT_96303 [Exidia glandulosa HHB12029]|uniref:Uncharacterized protein n=1 Tax=Exidia glandulosa HHB12029 TaxID=1314781 RepID=A0A165H4A6_EXIGL|nr:hypothetical protein EXIGLDRAFT_96303 [Exidia glandulosa HHB12029]